MTSMFIESSNAFLDLFRHRGYRGPSEQPDYLNKYRSSLHIAFLHCWLFVYFSVGRIVLF